MVAKTWGDYEINLDLPIGRGGMGAVYRGRQVSVNRPVAIKVLKRDLTENPDFVLRFHREATLLAKLVDSHIVQVFGAGEADGQHFYAMEFVEGEDLASRLRRGHQFTPDEILRIAIGTGNALAAAWKHKIIHRDIKPSNIIVAQDQVVKVMDFGLAKNPENDLTQTEVIMGTAKYMSPEQATGGACDIRSDLYSLGAVLYELGTGTAPFVGESPTAVIYQHVHKDPVPPQKLNPSLPQALQAVVMRLLAKSPEQRYQTPEELVKDCRAILEGVTPDEKTILYGELGKAPPGVDRTSVVPAEDDDKPSRALVYVSVAAAVLLLGGIGYLVVPAILAGSGPGRDGWERKYEKAIAEAKKAAVAKNWDLSIQHFVTAQNLLPKEDARRKEVDALIQATRGEQHLASADEKFNGQNWRAAIPEYEKAHELLPSNHPRRQGVPARIANAEFNLIMEQADRAPDLRQRIKAYEQAQRIAGLDAESKKMVSERLHVARVQLALQGAEEKERKEDWNGAGRSYDAASKSEADEEKKKEYAAKASFYLALAELIHVMALATAETDPAKALRGWETAGAKAAKLLTLPDHFGKIGLLQKHKRTIDKEVRTAKEKERKQRKDRYEGEMAEADRAYREGRWADAGKALDRASAESYREFRDADAAFQGLKARMERVKKTPKGMVYVPEREYRIGGNTGRDIDGPAHKKLLKDFYIDAREVTVGEYALFLAALPPEGHDPKFCPPECPKKENGHVPYKWDDQKGQAGEHVTGVDWWSAYAYARWAGKRLPTEEEMEAAASTDLATGAKRLYPWGDRFGSGKGKSPLGLEGLDNKIREWTANKLYLYPGSKASTSAVGQDYVLRGGYKIDPKEELKTGYRHWEAPRKNWNVGFRCALSVE